MVRRSAGPAQISDSRADGFSSWFATRHRSAAESYRLSRGGGYVSRAMADQARWTLLRRTYSQRQVLEVMTEFWQNHLHVDGGADKQWLWRSSYDALIRRHALGRFDEMLQAAIVHPSMLTYLDGDLSVVDRRSTAAGGVVVTEQINENLGRELLELHTVGRTAGYSESQVTDSARILTGSHIDRFKTWEYSYQPEMHYTGPVTVMGFSSANSDRDGRAVLNEYLTYLAHHPATAQRIARKLAVRFVCDEPSTSLVDDLARVFLDSGTDIRQTLRALVRHPEFLASVGDKIRTPTEDLIQTLRVYGVAISRPVNQQDAANAIYYIAKTAGQVPFGWGAPDGFPDNGPVWSSSSRIMGSYHVHYSLAGGHWPDTGVRYRSHASWLPERRLRFDSFVDHLCRVLLGRGSTRVLLGAACIATDQRPSDVVTRSCVLVKYRMPKLLGILLDTPQHLTR